MNIMIDIKKMRLNIKYNNHKEILNGNFCQYDLGYIKEYKKKDYTIINFSGNKDKMKEYNNMFAKEFSPYNSILKELKGKNLIIPIVLSSDDKYAPFMYTTMLSILENGKKETFYIFYLLVPYNFSKSNQKIIQELANKYNCYLNFIYIKKIFDDLIMKISHITMPTYYRLLIGDLLPRDLDKCIYLDVDICVIKDLTELFYINMENNYIAGVVSPTFYINEKSNCKRLNLPSMKQYVNAGVLLINLKQIRRNNMTKKFIELSKKNYKIQDQDVLNVACYGKIITLPPKFNAMTSRLQLKNPLIRDLYTEDDINEAKNSPFIIHYSDKNKPWNNIGIYMENYWWDIAKKTPYINKLFTREKIYKGKLQKFYKNKTRKHLNLDKP